LQRQLHRELAQLGVVDADDRKDLMRAIGLLAPARTRRS
jgi:hypothetical protein